MAVDINAAITVCGVNIHVHSISASNASNKAKAYYQHRHPGHESHWIMKKNYGMNYRQKLSETRVQIAIDLLCNSDMPIHKIAEILGYSCSANFSAFIKRNTGKTPSQIRKEQ